MWRVHHGNSLEAGAFSERRSPDPEVEHSGSFSFMLIPEITAVKYNLHPRLSPRNEIRVSKFFVGRAQNNDTGNLYRPRFKPCVA
jgi:hypothetical protein